MSFNGLICVQCAHLKTKTTTAMKIDNRIIIIVIFRFSLGRGVETLLGATRASIVSFQISHRAMPIRRASLQRTFFCCCYHHRLCCQYFVGTGVAAFIVVVFVFAVFKMSMLLKLKSLLFFSSR